MLFTNLSKKSIKDDNQKMEQKISDLENINARFGIGSQKWQEMKNNPLVDEKVIPFSVADMEFKLAPEITEGLKKFIDDNILGYAGTNKKYRESVCKWQQKHHDFELNLNVDHLI